VTPQQIQELDLNRAAYISAMRAAADGLRRMKAGLDQSTFIVQSRNCQMYFHREDLARTVATTMVDDFDHDYVVVLQVVQLAAKKKRPEPAASAVVGGAEADA
jgi:hypothetical protein